MKSTLIFSLFQYYDTRPHKRVLILHGLGLIKFFMFEFMSICMKYFS